MNCIDFLGKFVIDWLVSFDFISFMFFNDFGLVVLKLVFKLIVLSKIYNYDNLFVRIKFLRVFIV